MKRLDLIWRNFVAAGQQADKYGLVLMLMIVLTLVNWAFTLYVTHERHVAEGRICAAARATRGELVRELTATREIRRTYLASHPSGREGFGPAYLKRAIAADTRALGRLHALSCK